MIKTIELLQPYAEEIEKLYVDEKLSVERIANRLAIKMGRGALSYHPVRKILIQRGVKIRTAKRGGGWKP